MSIEAIVKVMGYDLPPREKYILILYANYSNKEGKGVYPSQETMMELSGYKSRTTIVKVTTVLKESGLIIPEGRSEYNTLEWTINLDWKGKRKDVLKEIKKYNKDHSIVHMGVHMDNSSIVHTGVHSDVHMGEHSNVQGCVHDPLVNPSDNPLIQGNKVNNNNKENNIITASLKKKILSMGWVGSLGEIIKLYNDNPDYVKAWVDEIYQVDLYPRAGLLREALRSGNWPPADKETKDYLSDEFADFIED